MSLSHIVWLSPEAILAIFIFSGLFMVFIILTLCYVLASAPTRLRERRERRAAEQREVGLFDERCDFIEPLRVTRDDRKAERGEVGKQRAIGALAASIRQCCCTV